MEFILFLVIVLLLFWVNSLSNRIGKLETGFANKPMIQKMAAPRYEGNSAMAENGTFFSEKQSLSSGVTSIKEDNTLTAQNTQEALKVSTVAERIPKPSVKDEDEIATNWLNKIGIVAVLLGMGFFFKYAVDQNWISPVIRISIGVVVGALFILLGWLWRKKYEKYSNVMMGGGIGIWYFTIFAAYVFYSLVPQSIALGFMVTAAVVSVVLSFKRNSLALAVLGLVGAYGAPGSLGLHQMSQIQFLIYLSILNFAVIGMLVKHFWTSLILFASVATWLNLSLWTSYGQGSQNTIFGLAFLMLFLFMFLVGVAGIIQNHSIKKTLPTGFVTLTSVSVFIVALIYISFVYNLLAIAHHGWLVWAGLFGTVVVFLSYAIIDRLEFEGLNYSLSLVGSFLLLLSWVWQWQNEGLALAIILSGGLGAGLAAWLKRKEIRLWSTFLILIGLVGVLFLEYGNIKEQLFIFNTKFGLMLLEVMVLFFAGWLYKFTEAKSFEKNSEKLLAFLGIILLWGAVSMDIVHFFKTLNGQYGLAFWWILYPVILSGIGAFFKKPGLLKLGLVLTVFGLVKCLILPYPNEGAKFIFNFKFGLMALQTISIFIMAKCMDMVSEDESSKKASAWTLFLGALLLWVMVSVDVFGTFMGYSKLYALALWWVIYPVLLVYYAFIQKNGLLSKLAMVLMVVGFLRVLFLGYNPETYLFVFNAKFGLMILEVLAILTAIKYLPNDFEKDKTGNYLKVVASLLLWYAFSWELVRYYNKPEDGNTRNLLMSLWWIIYATVLIIIGAVFRSLIFRKIALALFGVSIVKVFLYDALSLEMGYRIVSFIVLGVILLSVSFAYQKNKEKIKKFLEGEGGKDQSLDKNVSV